MVPGAMGSSSEFMMPLTRSENDSGALMVSYPFFHIGKLWW